MIFKSLIIGSFLNFIVNYMFQFSRNSIVTDSIIFFCCCMFGISMKFIDYVNAIKIVTFTKEKRNES